MYITFRCMAGGAWEPHRKRSAWKRPSGCCGWCKWSGRHSDRWRRIYITLWSRPTHRVTLSRALSVVINVISPSLPPSFRRTEDQQASWGKARVLVIGALEGVHNPPPLSNAGKTDDEIQRAISRRSKPPQAAVDFISRKPP